MKKQEIRELLEVAEYWQTHDSVNEFESSEEVEIEVDLRRNLLHPRLTTLTHRPTSCPRCADQLEDVMIEYVTSAEDHILVIREVPALRCRENGHEYLLEETLDRLEHLISLEQDERVEPEEILSVPVFNLRKSA